MNLRSSAMSSRISEGGRDQFSALKEKIVRKVMPRSPAARTVRRSASTPRRCPSPRGSPRAAAQRPFPSMMMATCRGTAISSIRALPNGLHSGMFVPFSHGENFLFFRRQHPVHFADRLVGCLLHLLTGSFSVVLADLVVLLELLEYVEAITSYMTDRHAGGLGIAVRNLDQLPAAFFIKLGDAQPQHLPLGGRGKAEVGRGNRLFHCVHHRLVPDLHRDQPRLGHADRCNLVERHVGSIGLDLDRFEQACRSATSSKPAQLLLQQLNCTMHATLELVEIVCRACHDDTSSDWSSASMPSGGNEIITR